MGAESLPKQRPLGVTILAALAVTAALGEIAWALTRGSGTDRGISGESWWIGAIAPLARALLGLLYFAVGIGLWKLRRWARGVVIGWSVLAMGAVLIIIGTNLWPTEIMVSLWFLLIVAGLNVLCLRYMFTRKVKQEFSS